MLICRPTKILQMLPHIRVCSGRLADVRLHGAFRLNPITGEKEMVDGGGDSMIRIYSFWASRTGFVRLIYVCRI